MLAQFLNRRMVVIGDQVGEREVRRIEDARFAAEQLEQRAVSSTTSREKERSRNDP